MMRPDAASEAEAQTLLEGIRQVQLPPYYAFQFVLRYMPNRGDDKWMEGRLWGSWNSDVSSLRLYFPKVDEKGSMTCFSYTGENSEAYVACNTDDAEKVDLEKTTEELIPGMGLTLFDIQMPYLHWKESVYEGPIRFMGRPAHRFILYPQQDKEYGSIGAVRVYIDEDYRAVLKAEVLDHSGDKLRSFEVGSLKKINGIWIVKELNFVDETTKSKARVMIVAAALNVPFNLAYLKPESSSNLSDPVPDEAYEYTR
jgi:hypothetical protein